MHDAVKMEERGVPAALVVTEPFLDIAAAFAPTVGAPGYPAIAVPHPVSSKDDDTLRKYAAGIAEQVAAQLVLTA